MDMGGSGDLEMQGTHLPSSPSKPSDFDEDPTTSTLLYSQLHIQAQAGGLLQLFRNELVAEKISQFLTLSDMKAVSEVSSGLSHTVRRTKRFSDSAMLIISKETVALDYFLVDSTYPWKVVQIDVSLPIQVIDIIPHILQTVRTLQIRILMNDKVDDKDLVRHMTFLITNSPHLRTLQIESTIMDKILYDLFSDLTVQSQLSKLKCFEICSSSYAAQATHYIDGTDGDEGPFPRNFLQLSMLPLCLETFKTWKVCTFTGGETEHVKFIPNIVSANQDTLKELSLHLNVWRLDDMKMIRCPNLQRLTITAYQQDSAVIIAFLINQPLLEELTVDMRDGFPLSLLSAIEGRCSKLRKLHLKGKLFTEISSREVDWKFLQNIETLRDFSISRPLCILNQGIDQYGNGLKFMNSLPTGLKKLRLRGLDKFWYQRDPVADTWNELPIPEVEKLVVLDLFKNVTELSLIRCANALDNKILQHICQEFRHLRVLELSHCSALTDYGLTGIPSADDVEWDEAEPTGISLKNLTALTEFKLRACPSVTPAALLQVVTFPYLRSFDYLSVVASSKDFIMSIARQNPSLESFSVFVSELDSVQQIKGDLKTINSRVWKFCNLNEEEWVDVDSDSDADCYDQFGDESGDGMSDISGGIYPDHDYYGFGLNDDFDLEPEDDYEYVGNGMGEYDDDVDDDYPF